MILLTLGIILGLLIALVLLLTAVYLKEKGVEIIETIVDNRPKEKGMIIEPMTLREETQQHIIDENTAQGKDTKLSDLE